MSNVVLSSVQEMTLGASRANQECFRCLELYELLRSSITVASSCFPRRSGLRLTAMLYRRVGMYSWGRVAVGVLESSTFPKKLCGQGYKTLRA
eukprot:229772-Amphidinium_carterae.1